MDIATDTEFSEYMHGRWTQLVRLGYGLTGDRQLAEDLAQTALARAYASWPRVRRSGNPDAYVNRIMVNANYGRFRKRRVAERLTDTLPDPGAGDVTGEVTDGHDDRSALITALLTLPYGQRGARGRARGRTGPRDGAYAGVSVVTHNVVGAGPVRPPPVEAGMGLMDKVKAQATVLAQKTQETAREGMARLDQATASRHADTMLRNLGALVYAEQTGRAAPDSADQVARLVSQLSAHEAENGINLAAQPAGWNPAAPGTGMQSQDGPGQGGPGQGGPGQGAPGPGGPGPFGGTAPAGPEAPPQPPFGGQPSQPPQPPFGGQAPGGPAGPGAAGPEPFGGPAAGSGYTQPEYTFPQPPSGDDDTPYPPEPGSTPSS